MYTLYIDDYFDAEVLQDILVTYGYDLINRSWTAVSTTIEVEDVDGDYTIEDIAAAITEELYVTVQIA